MIDTVNLDDFGFSFDKFVPRLLDMLGYPVSNVSSTTDKAFYTSLAALATPPSFNPFRLLAYQRLFYDFYRNTDYDVNLPSAYNIDNLAGGSNLSYIKDMFAPRYVQWRKDRFTSVKPQPLSTFRPPIDKWGPNNLEGNTSPSGVTTNANYVGAVGSVSGSASTLAMTVS